MNLKLNIRVILWLSASLIVIITLSVVALVEGCSNSYWWDRDQWNQEKIVKAYIAFYAAKTNFPSSLADLVKAGYLPEKAEWYKEPPGFFAHPVDFKESSYVVLAPESGEVERLKMIGRRVRRDGKEEIEFSPPSNADIRDGVKQIQANRK